MKKKSGMLVCHMSSLKTLISMSKKKKYYDLFYLSCQFFFSKKEKNIVVDNGLWREEKFNGNLKIVFMLPSKCMLIELLFRSS